MGGPICFLQVTITLYMTIMLGSIVGSAALVVAGVVIGAVAGYLVLRANPNKKAAVDSFTNDASKKL